VDFLDYGGLFVGNVADIAIVVAAVVMALLTIAGIPYAAAGADDGPTR
jgi:signal peptidase II